MSRELFGRQLSAGFLRVIDGVAEALREAVHGLAHAKQIEANSTFIECALGRLSRAIQFLTQPIEECHFGDGGRGTRDGGQRTSVHELFPRAGAVAAIMTRKRPPNKGGLSWCSMVRDSYAALVASTASAPTMRG